MLTTIGFFSYGTPYEEEAKILRASLDRLKMPHVITGFPDRGTWYQNTAAKAELIRDARRTLKGPLLYVDVDAFVHVNPTAWLARVVADNYDLGVHMFAGPAKGRGRSKVCRCVRRGYGTCTQEHRLLSGTLFLGDTEGARKLCDAWVARNEELRAQGIVEGGGQKNLWYVTTQMPELRIYRLPGRFCIVGDKLWAYPANEPIWIEHTIASRENRDVRGRFNAWRRRRITELRGVVGL